MHTTDLLSVFMLAECNPVIIIHFEREGKRRVGVRYGVWGIGELSMKVWEHSKWSSGMLNEGPKDGCNLSKGHGQPI